MGEPALRPATTRGRRGHRRARQRRSARPARRGRRHARRGAELARHPGDPRRRRRAERRRRRLPRRAPDVERPPAGRHPRPPRGLGDRRDRRAPRGGRALGRRARPGGRPAPLLRRRRAGRRVARGAAARAATRRCARPGRCASTSARSRPSRPSGRPASPCAPRARRTDDETVYETDMEAFADGWDFSRMEYSAWRRWTVESPRFDPSLWYLAEEGGEVAGICLCSPHRSGDPAWGWVDTLGVRKPWRGRGLGTALLRHAFRELHGRGMRRVDLDVDTENSTGAVRLYERAGMRRGAAHGDVGEAVGSVTLRSARWEDAEAVADLFNRVAREQYGTDDSTAEEVLRFWRSPRLSPSRTTWSSRRPTAARSWATATTSSTASARRRSGWTCAESRRQSCSAIWSGARRPAGADPVLPRLRAGSGRGGARRRSGRRLPLGPPVVPHGRRPRRRPAGARVARGGHRPHVRPRATSGASSRCRRRRSPTMWEFAPQPIEEWREWMLGERHDPKLLVPGRGPAASSRASALCRTHESGRAGHGLGQRARRAPAVAAARPRPRAAPPHVPRVRGARPRSGSASASTARTRRARSSSTARRHARRRRCRDVGAPPVSRLRARCPVCETLTAVALGTEYECHSCGRVWEGGLVRVPRAWGKGGEAMAEAARLPLPWPEAAVVDQDTLAGQTLEIASDLPARPLVLGGCCCAHVGAVEGLAARHDRLARRLARRPRRPEHAGHVALRQRVGHAASHAARRRHRRAAPRRARRRAQPRPARARSSSPPRECRPGRTRSSARRPTWTASTSPSTRTCSSPARLASFMPEPGGPIARRGRGAACAGWPSATRSSAPASAACAATRPTWSP